MRSNSTIIAVLITATSLSVAGSELTLDEAVSSALMRNPTITAAAARADAAAARTEQTKAYRLPSVDLTTAFNRTDSPAEVFGLQLNQQRFDMNEFFSSDPNSPDPLSNWMARLEVTLPVYTGGTLTTRMSQADHLAEAALYDLAHAREQAAFETISAYINLTQAREMINLLERSRLTAQRHLELAEATAAQGLLLYAEVLRAKVYVAELDDHLARAVAGARVAAAALNLAMGRDLGTPTNLAPVPARPAANVALATWISNANDHRHDLLAATSRLAAGRLEEKVAVAAFKPEIALIARYEVHDDAPFGSNGDATALMAVARINLFRGGADRAAVVAATADTASGEAEIHRFQEGISLQVEQAWLDIGSARARLVAAKAAVAASKEALRVREHRFAQGLEKMIDLVDAETSLHQAQIRELTARNDLTLSLNRLHFTAGSTLAPSASTMGKS